MCWHMSFGLFRPDAIVQGVVNTRSVGGLLLAITSPMLFKQLPPDATLLTLGF